VTRRVIGIGMLIALIVAAGMLIVMEQRGFSGSPSVPMQSITPPSTSMPLTSSLPSGRTRVEGASPGDVWSRPTASVAARQYRRRGFAWILRQLGADRKLLDRLTDGDLVAALTELKRQAAAGELAAINILGEFAHQQCYLGRDNNALNEYEAWEMRNAQALSPADLTWFSAAFHEDIAHDKQVFAACKRLIDQDEVHSWVVGRANQGDGASLWLLFNSADNMTEMQQRLRDAAATGFPEAQFELAGAIIAGQQGAAGTGPDAVNAGDLLKQAAEHLPPAEGQLAVCEYYGCPGVAPDMGSAVTHARDAAEKGSIDAMIAIGPHLPAGQIDPNEVSAWNLVNAWLQQAGCAGNGFSVQSMKKTTEALGSLSISAQSRALADQYWRTYESQMMSNLGCTP
jgi:hypothetical protein